VTTCSVGGCATVGVPLMTPVRSSRVRPRGRGGADWYCVMKPPLLVGVMAAIARPAVKTRGAPNDRPVGGRAAMTRTAASAWISPTATSMRHISAMPTLTYRSGNASPNR